MRVSSTLCVLVVLVGEETLGLPGDTDRHFSALYAEQAQYHGLQAVDTRRHLVTLPTDNCIAEFLIHTFKWQNPRYCGKVRSERSGFRTTFGGGQPATQ